MVGYGEQNGNRVEDYQSTHLVFGVAPFGGSHTIVGSVTVTMP
jgi:hypothetical protein